MGKISMSHNQDRLLAILNQEADLIDKLNSRSEFRYKSIQRLILETGQPFSNRIKSPFKGEPKSCFKNCFQARWEYPQLSYCEGFAIDDDLNLAISHAWLINDAHEVIDPTWDDAPGCTYFGVVFHHEFVIEIAMITKRFGILNNDLMNDRKLQRQGFPDGALVRDSCGRSGERCTS